jgi:hypothetical protein
MPTLTRYSPTSTSRGRSERRGESVDQLDHNRVRGFYRDRREGGLAVREPRVVTLRGWLWWSAWCSGTVCTASAA